MYVLKGIGDYHPDVKKLPQARPPVKPGALPKSTLKPRISAVDVTSITFSSSSTRIAVCGGCSVEISPLQTVQICGGSCGKKCHVGCIGAGRECTKCKSPANKCAQCTEDIPTGVAYNCSICERAVCSSSCLQSGFCSVCINTKGQQVLQLMTLKLAASQESG